MLKISPHLSLPLDAVTQTFGILAVRGAGKSNAAAVMAEQMFAAGLPFVAVDPVGSWRGLRSSGDGKGPGLAIPIFGGKWGDVPLERTGGNLIADLIVDQRLSCVLDLSTFDSEGSKKAFLLDFARRLYTRNEEPLHLFLEEADDYIPQKPMRDEAQLLRAWENIVRRGRARGLGITLITQRSASINKNVLTQAETLIALRTTSPQDRAAIEAWIKYHAEKEDVLSSLAELEDGEAWVWSPQWLKKTVRIRFNRRSTFDSGATPKFSKATRAPATLADVDLQSITEKMAATIERAKADDPKELRRQIAELQKQAKAKSAPSAPVVERVEVPVLDAAALNGIRTLAGAVADDVTELIAKAEQIVTRAGYVLREIDRIKAAAPSSVVKKQEVGAPTRISELHKSAKPVTRDLSDVKLGAGERRVLTAIAQHGSCTREQLTVLTGYKRSSRDTYIQRLKAAGFVEQNGERIDVLADGVRELGPDFEPLPTGKALYVYWLERLPEGEKRILGMLGNAYPRAVPRDELSEDTGYKRSSRDTYIQRLRSRELIEISAGSVRASKELMEA